MVRCEVAAQNRMCCEGQLGLGFCCVHSSHHLRLATASVQQMMRGAAVNGLLQWINTLERRIVHLGCIRSHKVMHHATNKLDSQDYQNPAELPTRGPRVARLLLYTPAVTICALTHWHASTLPGELRNSAFRRNVKHCVLCCADRANELVLRSSNSERSGRELSWNPAVSTSAISSTVRVPQR